MWIDCLVSVCFVLMYGQWLLLCLFHFSAGMSVNSGTSVVNTASLHSSNLVVWCDIARSLSWQLYWTKMKAVVPQQSQVSNDLGQDSCQIIRLS